jgi:hypothetical protein
MFADLYRREPPLRFSPPAFRAARSKGNADARDGCFHGGVPGDFAVRVFFGAMLMIAPNKCPRRMVPGEPNVTLLRKPPLALRERLFGLILVMLIVFLFSRPVLQWISHPVAQISSRGKSPFAAGTPRWDHLAFGVAIASGGYYLLTRT